MAKRGDGGRKGAGVAKKAGTATTTKGKHTHNHRQTATANRKTTTTIGVNRPIALVVAPKQFIIYLCR